MANVIFYEGDSAQSILTAAIFRHFDPDCTIFNTGGNSEAEITAYINTLGAATQTYGYVASEVGLNANDGIMTAANVTALDAKCVGLSATAIWAVSGTDYPCKQVWDAHYSDYAYPKIISDMMTYSEAVPSGACTQTTLVDAGTWTADEQIGKYVVITRGQGAGQVRLITDNTANALTVASWDVLPFTTSYYIIVDTLQEAYAQYAYNITIPHYLSNVAGSIKIFKSLFDPYVTSIAPQDREQGYDNQKIIEMLNGTYGRDLLFPTWTS